MAFDLNWFFDALKLSTRFVLPIALTLGVVLFAPDGFIQSIGLSSLRQQHQPYLGGAFLLSSCVLGSRGALRIGAWARLRYRQNKNMAIARARLHNLTAEEQKLLRSYLERETRSINLDVMSGVVSGLVSADVIYRSANLGRTSVFAHNIQPWAWDYLHEHPELVGLTPEDQPNRSLHG